MSSQHATGDNGLSDTWTNTTSTALSHNFQPSLLTSYTPTSSIPPYARKSDALWSELPLQKHHDIPTLPVNEAGLPILPNPLLPLGTHTITCLCKHPSNSYVAAGTRDGEIMLVATDNIPTAIVRITPIIPPPPAPLPPDLPTICSKTPPSWITAISFLTDTTLLISTIHHVLCVDTTHNDGSPVTPRFTLPLDTRGPVTSITSPPPTHAHAPVLLEFYKQASPTTSPLATLTPATPTLACFPFTLVPTYAASCYGAGGTCFVVHTRHVVGDRVSAAESNAAGGAAGVATAVAEVATSGAAEVATSGAASGTTSGASNTATSIARIVKQSACTLVAYDVVQGGVFVERKSVVVTTKSSIDRSGWKAGGRVTCCDGFVVTIGSGGGVRVFTDDLVLVSVLGEGRVVDSVALDYADVFWLQGALGAVPSWWRDGNISKGCAENEYKVVSFWEGANVWGTSAPVAPSVPATLKAAQFCIEMPGDGRVRQVVSVVNAQGRSQLWACGVDGRLYVCGDGGGSNWPGPMYPPGYTVVQNNYEYLEGEEELDVVLPAPVADGGDSRVRKMSTDGGEEVAVEEEEVVDVTTVEGSTVSSSYTGIKVQPEKIAAVALRMSDEGISMCGVAESGKYYDEGMAVGWLVNMLPRPSGEGVVRGGGGQVSGAHAPRGEPRVELVEYMKQKSEVFRGMEGGGGNAGAAECDGCKGVVGVMHRCSCRPLPASIDKAPGVTTAALAVDAFCKGLVFEERRHFQNVTKGGFALSEEFGKRVENKKRFRGEPKAPKVRYLGNVKSIEKRVGWKVKHESMASKIGLVTRAAPAAAGGVACAEVDFGTGELKLYRAGELVLHLTPEGATPDTFFAKPQPREPKEPKAKKVKASKVGEAPSHVGSATPQVEVAKPKPPTNWKDVLSFCYTPGTFMLNVAFRAGTQSLGLGFNRVIGVSGLAVSEVRADSALNRVHPPVAVSSILRSFNGITLGDSADYVSRIQHAIKNGLGFALQFFLVDQENEFKQMQIMRVEDAAKRSQYLAPTKAVAAEVGGLGGGGVTGAAEAVGMEVEMAVAPAPVVSAVDEMSGVANVVPEEP